MARPKLTVVYQPRELLHGGSIRAVKTNGFTLYRNRTPQLLVEELGIALGAKTARDGLDDVLDGLGVV
jgi:hypothetical protein